MTTKKQNKVLSLAIIDMESWAVKKLTIKNVEDYVQKYMGAGYKVRVFDIDKDFNNDPLAACDNIAYITKDLAMGKQVVDMQTAILTPDKGDKTLYVAVIKVKRVPTK